MELDRRYTEAMSVPPQTSPPAQTVHPIWGGSSLSHAKWCAWIVCVAALVLQTSVIEDAFIPLRVVKQFWAGHGLVWNVGERVQVSTSLLWQVLTLAFAWPDPLRGLVALCWVLSAATVALTVKNCRSAACLAVVTACWLVSFHLPSYMVSGLETPLSALALVAVASFRRQDPKWWALAVGMLPAIRHDLALIAVPQVLAFAWLWNSRERRTAALMMSAPLVLTTAFCLFYFGSALPNTAFAKMAACVPQEEVAEKGWAYIVCSFKTDPLLWVVPALSLWLGSRTLPRESAALALGWVLTILYAWLSAADYMSGRFLLPPVVMGIGLLSRLEATKTEWVVALAAILGGWSVQDRKIFCAAPPHAFQTPCIHQPTKGISVPLGRMLREDPLEGEELAIIGKNLPEHGVSDQGSIGIMGYSAPLNHRIKDFLALADPLTARLPSPRDPAWRPGHYYRPAPAGVARWEKSADVADILEPEVGVLADLVHAAAYSPELWSWSRFGKILKLQFWRPSPDLRLKMVYPSAKWERREGPVTRVTVESSHGVAVPVLPGEILVVESGQPFRATEIVEGKEGRTMRGDIPSCDSPASLISLEKIQGPATSFVHITPVAGSKLPFEATLYRTIAPRHSMVVGFPQFVRQQTSWDCSLRSSPVLPGSVAKCFYGKRLEGLFVLRLHPAPQGKFVVSQTEVEDQYVADGTVVELRGSEMTFLPEEPFYSIYVTLLPVEESRRTVRLRPPAR